MDAVAGWWMGDGFGAFRRWLSRGIALCCSAAAVCAFAYLQGHALPALGAAHPAPHIVRPLPLPLPLPLPVPASVELPVGVLPPPGVLVPHLAGESLVRAFAMADASGLKLVVRDRWGDRVHRRDARYYRVARQSVDAGELHAPEDPIHIRARERVIAMGY